MPIGLIGDVVKGAGSLFGGLLGSSGATSAAKVQADALNKASDIQLQEYQDVSNKLLPFLDIGRIAAQQYGDYFGINAATGEVAPGAEFSKPISAGVGPPPSPDDPALRTNFMASPGYNYLQQTGADAVQNSAAGRTGAVSGNMLRGLQSNATGLANQDWWNYYDALVKNYGTRYTDMQNYRSGVLGGLGTLAGAGQNAAAQLGGFGTTAATNIGSNTAAAGSAKAAGITGSTNALTNTLSSPSIYSAIDKLFSGLSDGGTSYSGGGDY